VDVNLDFDITGERREQNSLINDIRREVERWRANNWNGVTLYTRKLLVHWAAQPPDRDEPVLFCQREAAETAIFLTEVAGRHGTADYRRRLVDGTNKGSMFRLLTSCDLDWLIAGPGIIANSAAVPLAAIYEVRRAPQPLPGVSLELAVWAGKELTHVLTPDPADLRDMAAADERRDDDALFSDA